MAGDEGRKDAVIMVSRLSDGNQFGLCVESEDYGRFDGS